MKMTTKLLIATTALALALMGGASLFARQPQDQPTQTQGQDQAQPQDQGQAQAQPPQDQPPQTQDEPLQTQDQAPQDQGTADNGQDSAQKAPGVARLSMTHGAVSTQRGDSGDVTPGALNAPLEAGDKVSTGLDSRAEVQLDYANVLRLGDNSQANIATLDHSQIQVQIGEGIAYYSLYKGSEAAVEIDTPNVAIHPTSATAKFRIVVTSNQTEVTVRDGEAEFTTPGGSTRAHRGEMITIQGTGNDAQYKIGTAPARDSWDSFNEDRDRRTQNAESWRNTNHYYTGTADLDGYGTWTEVPDYGRVWVPSENPGWVPYSSGSWVWEPYFGWTWVGYEPWGWAPYHYGRWMVYGGRWGWWPGPVYGGGFYRPIWAPAYVSFFGFGGGIGIGVGFGFGSIGWLAIGPGDFFHPWWGGYGGRFGAVGIGNFRGGWGPLRAGDRYSNLHNLNTNAQVRAGLSTVGANNFGRGPVHATAASAESLRTGRSMTGNLPVVPSHESLSASGKFQPASAAGRAGASQHFFTNHQPAAHTGGFSQQASHVQQSIQKDGHFSPISANSGAEARGAESRGNSAAQPGNRSGGSAAGFGGNAARPGTNGATSKSPVSTESRETAGARSSGFADRPATSRPEGSPTAGTNASRPSSTLGGAGNANEAAGSNRANTSTSNNGFQRFGSNSSSSTGSRGPSSAGSTSGSRAPLQMNKPIVTQRPNSVYGNSGGYGSSARATPSYRAPSNPHGYSAPTNRAPSYSAPTNRAPSYSAPRSPAPSSRAPSYHAPSSGGSHGGSSHSAGGGSHSGGGHSSGGGGGHSSHH
jgi:hypothetical protein